MKNILFATTALVATAGFAQAEVTGSGPGTINITGHAEMGVMGGDVDGTKIESQFHTDIDVTFSMSGTADNGLTFGASVDLDESVSGTAFAPATQGGETIFVSFGGATLTMGDTNGAFDQAIKEVNYAGGSIGDNEEHIAFGGFGNNGLDGFYDGQVARFDYAFDSFTGSLSAEVDDTGAGNPVWGVGVRYAGQFSGVDLGVGLGYQAVEGSGALAFGSISGVGFAVPVADGSYSVLGVSVDAGFSNGVTAGFSYTGADLDGTDASHGAIGVAYEMNALAIGVNYGHYVVDDDEVLSGIGLAASYDLGGGLAAQLGYGASTVHGVGGGSDADINTWSLGLAMSF